MRMKKQKATGRSKAKGSITVEAAVVVPIALLCILWMAEAGITLYGKNVELIQEQEMWQEFYPAARFRKLELLGDMLDAIT